MKIALITVGLLATAISQASPAFALGTNLHLFASQHVRPDAGSQPGCKEYGHHHSASAQKEKRSPPACP
jgi:hypothetical protein